MTEPYDRASVARQLEQADPRGVRLFATMAAELLVRWFHPRVPLPTLVQEAQEITERSQRYLWGAVESGGAPTEGQALEAEIDRLLEEYADEIGSFEYTLSGLYYAIQVAAEGEAALAELAALKVYEGADSTALDRAQQETGVLQDEDTIRSLPEVQRALGFLRQALKVAVAVTPGADIAGSVHSAHELVDEAGRRSI